jgi:hypothetical protein
MTLIAVPPKPGEPPSWSPTIRVVSRESPRTSAGHRHRAALERVLIIRMCDWEDRPFYSANVVVFGTPFIGAQTDMQGIVRFAKLPADSLAIRIHALSDTGSSRFEFPVFIRQGETVKIDITLARHSGSAPAPDIQVKPLRRGP